MPTRYPTHHPKTFTHIDRQNSMPILRHAFTIDHILLSLPPYLGLVTYCLQARTGQSWHSFSVPGPNAGLL
jgi:hypothetical protein